jgi:hypothetical protein
MALLRNGTLEGLPNVQTISSLQGSARLANDRLEVEELSGMVLGSVWNAKGTVQSFAHPSVEALLSSRVELDPFVAAFPALKEAWHPEGRSDLGVVCRGPLRPQPFLDCLSHAEFRDVTLTGSTLTRPLTHMTGRIAYDHLTRRLSIEQVEGQLQGEQLATHGEVVFSNPLELSLAIVGTLNLEAVAGWMPTHGPVTEVGGLAALNLQVQGPSKASVRRARSLRRRWALSPWARGPLEFFQSGPGRRSR